MDEFRLDPAPAPRRVVACHPPDQLAKLSIEPRAADRASLGLPSPVEPEALAVPGEDGAGLNDDETRAPTRPQAREPDPEDPVPSSEPRAADRALEHPELVAQGKILEGDGRRAEVQGAEECPETDHEQHGATTPPSGMTSEPRLYRISDAGDEVSSDRTRRWSS
jgi:hypothetical protein